MKGGPQFRRRRADRAVRHDGEVIEIGTGSRRRSQGKAEGKTCSAKTGTDRHRNRCAGEIVLGNQIEKAARLEREIRELLAVQDGGRVMADQTTEKLRELTIELNLTRDVIHEYELRLRAVG